MMKRRADEWLSGHGREQNFWTQQPEPDSQATRSHDNSKNGQSEKVEKEEG